MLKVFLVDDEIAIREGIRNSFPWEESGYTLVGEAPDGELALHNIFDVNPDILITDIRMPFMDGMQLCRVVRQMMPRIGVIILTGYDDFSYAQQAISLGAHEYLLKPVSAQELRDALDRVASKLLEEGRTRKNIDSLRRRTAVDDRFLRERLLSTLFSDEVGEIDARQMIEQMRCLGVNLAANCYAAMDVSFSVPNKENAMEALFPLAEQSRDSVHICLVSHGAQILVLGDNENDTEERSYALAQSVVRELQSCGAERIFVAIGKTVNRLEEIPQSTKSARHIRRMSGGRKAGSVSSPLILGVRDAGNTNPGVSHFDIYPMYERLQYISESEFEKVFEEYLSAFGGAMMYSDTMMGYLQVEGTITAGRIVREAGGNPEEVLSGEWYDWAEGGRADISAVYHLLRKALAYRDSASPTRGNPDIARSRYFLSRNFTDPNLQLQDAAREACMSNSRFSTVFAQETGMTFTEYLSRLRLGRAKELLLSTDMRSSQIALESGYSDSHYFSYHFKKATGMTPSEFRRSSSKLVENEIKPK